MTFRPGTWLGHFEITAPLGAGAMGEVYRARDDRLKRDVAVKVLPAHTVTDARARKRLRREALALSKLNHPNIASVYDLGSHAGVDYLVMEFVDGETLSRRLLAGALTERELTAFAIQVGEALQEAHDHGVVHRDLKPGNIMVTKRGRAKVLDFGLSQSVTPATPDATTESLSSLEAIVGTLPYMAPEQLRRGRVDVRADVYALGVILYEMATGRRPFVEEQPAALAGEILHRAPEPLRHANPALSPRLETIVLKALRKDPNERHQTAQELVVALQGGAPLPTVASPGGPALGPMPRTRTSFVGREGEMAEIRRCFESTRLVTLTGSGGCGKTRLALEIAESLRMEYPDGVWLAELSPVADPLDVAQTVAAVFGIREQPGHPVIETLADSLGSRTALLVLDNCEHVLAAAGRVVESILDAGPGPRVLATSREALGVPGEEAVRVPSLSVSEATRLFTDRATSTVGSFSLTEESASLVARICQRLDGIPLAIELATARLKLLTLKEIDSRLEDSFRLLAGGTRTPLPRHQTLRALIDWSYNLLTDREQALFRRLAVFAGGWNVAVAEAVCADPMPVRPLKDVVIAQSEVLNLLTALVEKSLVLVQEDAAEKRCSFLETVRQYAAERLSESGEIDVLRNRHRDSLLEIAERNAHLKLTARLELFGRFHDNVRAAMDWSVRQRDPSNAGLRIATAWGEYWRVRGSFREGQGWLEKLLECNERIPASLRARALVELGRLSNLEGEYDKASFCHRTALALSEDLGDKQGIAAASGGLARDAQFRGDYESARMAYERCLSIYEELGDRTSIANSLNSLGYVACLEDQFERGVSLYKQSLAISRELKDIWGIASRLGNLATVTGMKGDTDAAVAMHRESLSLWLEIGDRRSIAEGLEMFAETLFVMNRMDRVTTLLGATKAVREAIGYPRSARGDDEVRTALASARSALGEDSFARAWAEGLAMKQAEAVAYALDSAIPPGEA